MKMLTVDSPVSDAKGVGPVTQNKLEGAGIRTVEDLLLTFPYRYIDMSHIQPVKTLSAGHLATVAVEVLHHRQHRIKGRRMTILEVELKDETGRLYAGWFNQPYRIHELGLGKKLLLHGNVRKRRARPGLEMLNPRIALIPEDESADSNPDLVFPVYRRLNGIEPFRLRRIIGGLLNQAGIDACEFLPQITLERNGLPARQEAFFVIHKPEGGKDFLRHTLDVEGRRRFAFEELLLVELALLIRKRNRSGKASLPAYSLEPCEEEHHLPFRYTGSQRKVLNEVSRELYACTPMNRFLQGDVGSGKTLIAFLAMKAVAEGGGQAALMAPTSLLAEQHFDRFVTLFPKLADATQLLIGGLSVREKRAVRNEIAQGRARVVIGTHALIEERVSFDDLHLVVIDEQQRFGVRQRADLFAKGHDPHFMAMTATPIPRSLAMILYGALDFSVLDERPPGRGEVRTHIRTYKDRAKVRDFAAREVRAGHQAFLVYPIIGDEEEEPDSVQAVLASVRSFSRKYPDVPVGVLHGRLDPEDRHHVMKKFAAGDIGALICTSVIEVGLDNPRATVMCIENAERFGLAQLHQMRGRIGRGPEPATCILIAGRDCSEKAIDKLKCLEETTDGFEVAEKDLMYRGPGELSGMRQWGTDVLRVADIRDDYRTLLAAKKEAGTLIDEGIENYPDLKRRVLALVSIGKGSPKVG
ncbi:ATP-dependent DNA helicase RecG [Acidobacteriota bacterium]